MGVSLAVISLFYSAAVRGKKLGAEPFLAGLAVWLISILVVLMSFSKIFALPRIVTNGGPVASTTSLSLYSYMMTFQRYELGYGAAPATLIIIATLLIAFVVWFLLTVFNLRLRYTAPGKAFSKGSWASLGSIPLILGAGFPIVLLVMWGFSLVQRDGGFEDTWSQVSRNELLANTIIAPWLTIWFIQIPVSYLATLALGFWRPFGRIGSSLLFLPLLALAFLPTEALGVSWYLSAQEAEIIDSASAQIFPWVFGAFSLIIFKMYFDGAYDAYHEARAAGKEAGDAFIMHVFLPSIPIALLVGGVLSFLAVQEFYWSLISSFAPNNHTISIATIAIFSAYRSGPRNFVAGVPVYFLIFFAIPFGIFFTLMQLFVVDRLALIAGTTKPVAETTEAIEEPIVMQSSFTDAPANPPTNPEAELPAS
jgi:ABC-type glycerol-3-phosphate transport system permease component